MTPRSYGEYCALAQTLDVVGDRWALLVVRELFSGPQRFTDLQGRLPGIGTNQLATRLRELEREHLIAKRVLPPPAASTVYELTEEGHRLEPAVFALVQFGIPRLRTLAPVNTFRAAWAALALRARVGTGPPPARPWIWEIHVEDEVFHIAAGISASTTGPGRLPGADAVIDTDTITAFALVRGEIKVGQALADGVLRSSDGAACRAWAKHSDLLR
jgi:DNA-binding HxlR family transcriptional regulator